MSRLLSITVPILAVLATLAACSKIETKPEEIRPVRAERISASRFDTQAGYAGEVRARYETRLAFRVGGKIISRHAEVGAQVKTGELLARLDPRDLQLAEESLEAQLASARAERDLAKADLDRYTDLYHRNFISKAEFDRRQSAFNTAAARFESVQAQLSQSANQASYSGLYADHAGVITAVETEAGQVVAAGQTVMRLARPEEKEVLISVPEHRVDELRRAQEIIVALWAQPDEYFAGQVREIAPSTDPVTRTYTAKIAVPGATDAMRLGMTATVYLRNKDDRPAIRLPLSAIHQKNRQASVWVVDEATGTVNLTPVQLGSFVDNEAIVLSGLKEGQTVVTAGIHMLHAGQKVRVLTASR